jgi:glycogen(starch) synthase
MPAYAARIVRVPLVIMTRHVSLPWKPHRVRTYTKLFDHFIPVSDAVRRRLAESGVPDDRMTVAKAGVPALEASAISKSDSFTVGSFGRLVAEKGTDTLVRAMALADGVAAQIYGDGPEAERLAGLVRETKVEERVFLNGRVANVADAMAGVDAVVIPSVWEEAFPYSALEAMSLGRPIIASDIGGLPELVLPGVNGVLFPPGNPDALAEKIVQVAREPESRVAMGRRGREIHRQSYTVAAFAERVESVYREQLDR